MYIFKEHFIIDFLPSDNIYEIRKIIIIKPSALLKSEIMWTRQGLIGHSWQRFIPFAFIWGGKMACKKAIEVP